MYHESLIDVLIDIEKAIMVLKMSKLSSAILHDLLVSIILMFDSFIIGSFHSWWHVIETVFESGEFF